MDQLDQIRECNARVFKTPIPPVPTRLSAGRKQWALTAFREETQEFEDAQTLEDELDACIDLAIFALGRVVEMGADAKAHFDEVMRANFDKVPGRVPQRDPGEGYFDGAKPAGWRGPDHASILARTAAEACEFEVTDAGKAAIASGRVAPPILLIGHGRHGKDTVAEMLRDRYGYTFTSSSLFCAEKVMLPAFEAVVSNFYRTVEECFNDRHGSSQFFGDHRTFWFETIKAYCTPDKARLAREIFAAGNDLYVGIRDEAELRAAQALPSVVTVWVDASNRVPPEGAGSMNLTADMADKFLDNNGSIEYLAVQVDALMKELLA